jgi:hypothetical protein
MQEDPVVRARHLQSLLEEVRALPEPSRGAVLGAIGAERLRQVDEAASSDWLPFVQDVELTHAVASALGPEGMVRFFRKHQLASFQGPLFKVLVDGATTLFGLDPGSWARWIPRGWGVVFRACGRWEISRATPGEVDLALIDPPDGCLDDEVWLRSVAGSFSAFLAVAKAEGEFALDRVDRERGAACYRLRWRRG